MTRRRRIAVASVLAVVVLIAGTAAVGASGATRGWHGGSRITTHGYNTWADCTLGFQAYWPDDTVKGFTAAHCFTAINWSWGNVDATTGNWFTWADVGLSPVADVATVNLGGQGTAAASGHLWSDVGLRQIGGFQRTITPGQLLCWHGSVSGDSCGTVVRSWPQPSNLRGGLGAARMWEVRVTWGRGLMFGDSGAVVYDPAWTLVAGITPAGGPETIMFYDLTAIETAVGLPVGALRPVT